MKAILIIDVPEKWEIKDIETLIIRLGNAKLKQETSYKNISLKSIPIKKMTESLVYANGEVYMRQNCFTEYDKGWNACIDEILGEKNEKDEQQKKTENN